MVNRGLIARGGVLEDVLSLEDAFSSPWPRGHIFKSLALASKPQKLPCPRLKDSTIFWMVKFCRSAEKCFSRPFFFFFEIDGKKIFKTFFLRKTLAFVSLALASSIPILGLGLGFFFVSLASSLVSSTPPLLITFGTHFERSETIWTNLIAEIWQHLYFWVEFFKWFG